MAKRDKEFEFPKDILEKINECSFGGFILFNFDKHGDPQTFIKFDDKIAFKAMESYLITLAKSLEHINVDKTISSIIQEED
jgi:hypothetical protein